MMRKYMTVLTFAIIAMFTLSACGEGAEPAGNANEQDLPAQSQVVEPSLSTEIDGIFHQFDVLGFSIVFPYSWENLFDIEKHEFNNEDGVTKFLSVFHPATREELESDYVGWLFSIIRSPSDFYENPHGVILTRDGDYTFLANFPTDVQWNYQDPDSVSAPEYREMSEQIVYILDSFRLID